MKWRNTSFQFGSIIIYIVAFVLPIVSLFFGLEFFLFFSYSSFVTLLFVNPKRIMPWIFAIVWLFAEMLSQTPFGVIVFCGLFSTYVMYWLAEKFITNRSWISAVIIAMGGITLHFFSWHIVAVFMEKALITGLFPHILWIYLKIVAQILPAMMFYFFAISLMSSSFREQLLFKRFYFWRIRN